MAIYVIPWTLLLLAPLFGMFTDIERTEYIGAWLLLISAFIFGLPHGACDFWILQKTARNKKNSFYALILIYLTLALLTVSVWLFFPGVALISFLLLAAWHFGSGDAIWEKNGEKFWQINSLGRGLIVIFAPIAFHQTESGRVLSGLTGNSEMSNVGLILDSSPYLLLTGIFALIFETFLTKNSAALKIQLTKWTEVLILLTTFYLTSPILAVAFYLVGVHSWRHILRLEVYANVGEKTFREKTVRQNLVSFHKRALPMTALSLFGLAVIVWFWKIGLNDVFEMTYVYLILLSALTVPHALMISWIEKRDLSPMFPANI